MVMQVILIDIQKQMNNTVHHVKTFIETNSLIFKNKNIYCKAMVVNVFYKTLVYYDYEIKRKKKKKGNFTL